MEQHTIICKPAEFNTEFAKWSQCMHFDTLVITHDGTAHYIVYQLEFTESD